MAQRAPSPEEEAEIRQQLREMFINFESMTEFHQLELIMIKFRVDREAGKYT